MTIRSCFVGVILVYICLSNSYGQVINSLTVVPANPTSQDTLLLLANCTFSSSGCNAYDTTILMTGNYIQVNSLHCLGMLPTLCDYTDTFKLGPLPVGTYWFIYHIDQGFGGPPCTPGIVPGPSDSIIFMVDSASTNCPMPTAGFDFSASGLAVSFTDSSQTSGPVQYAWTFGDGSSSISQNPTYTYTYLADSIYTVCLTVTDSCGIDSACHTLTVLENPTEIHKRSIFEPMIALFPNPATNKLHYSISGYSFIANKLNLIICSLDGAVLCSRLLKTNMGVLDLNLNNGIYVCVFKNEELISNPRKIIIVKQ